MLKCKVLQQVGCAQPTIGDRLYGQQAANANATQGLIILSLELCPKVHFYDALLPIPKQIHLTGHESI
jgi:hypothetical protein